MTAPEVVKGDSLTSLAAQRLAAGEPVTTPDVSGSSAAADAVLEQFRAAITTRMGAVALGTLGTDFVVELTEVTGERRTLRFRDADFATVLSNAARWLEANP